MYVLTVVDTQGKPRNVMVSESTETVQRAAQAELHNPRRRGLPLFIVEEWQGEALWMNWELCYDNEMKQWQWTEMS